MLNYRKICIKNSFILTKNLLRQDKRYAGHAKWQNIKHIKAEKDAEKSAMIASFVKKMKVAIAEGKSYKPLENLRLAQIIEDAKKKCVPASTISGVLEKAEKSKMKSQTDYVDFRGPGGSIFVIKIVSDNPPGVKMNLNTVLKKTQCQLGDAKMRHIFAHRGIILARAIKDLNGATDDAITVGAEEVEEIEDEEKYNRFICDPGYLQHVTTKLKTLNYDILSTDEEFVPNVTVEIGDEDAKRVDVLFRKLNQFDEIVLISHNIDFHRELEKSQSES